MTVLSWIQDTGVEERIARVVLNTTLLKQVFQNSKILLGIVKTKSMKNVKQGWKSILPYDNLLPYWTNVKTLAYPLRIV